MISFSLSSCFLFVSRSEMDRKEKASNSKILVSVIILPILSILLFLVFSLCAMIEEGRYCPDILTQLRAIRSAIKGIELRILDTHLSSCVTEACISQNPNEQRKKIEEVRELIKRFE